MTDPPDEIPRPTDPPTGTVTTASPPPDPPATVPDPAPEISVVETDITVEVSVVEPENPPDVELPPDEAETVELALSDLHEAAAALDPGEGAIDPRIRERRIAVTRAQGRRRLRILTAVVAVASAIGIAWLVVNSPFLALDEITIQGTGRESPEAVRVAAGVDEGSALLFVDTGDVARRIEKLPWIAEAKVVRDLPHDLRVTVVERLPVAWLRRPPPAGSPRGTEGPVALVDVTGRVLGDEPSPPVGLPEIQGTEIVGIPGSRISPAVTALAVALLPDALRAQAAALTRDEGQWVVKLVAPPGGVEPAADEVRLGRLEDVTAKGASALAVLDQLAAEEAHVTYIDVRVPGAPATR